MMVEETRSAPRNVWRKLAVQMVAGGLFGFAAGWAMVPLVESGALGRLGLSQEIALLVALTYAAVGVLVGVGMLVPKAGAQLLNFEDEAELRDQRRMMAWSAVSMLVMAAMLVLLALGAPGGQVSPGVALGATLAIVAALVWASRVMLRDMDELMRSITREAGEVGYCLLWLVGGGWAVLAHLGFVPAMGMLDFITLNFVLVLVASFIAAGRRGMLKPR